MTRVPDIFSSSIVAVGAFNPAIFTPDWLERNGLIGADDANAARQSNALIVSKQVSVIDTDWFTLQVLDSQLTLSSKGGLSPTLQDLAVGIFTLMSQTPVIAVGLNFEGDYKIGTLADYHKFGDVLAPKTIWNQIFPTENQSIGMNTLSIRVQTGSRDGNVSPNQDQRNITVQPSSKIRVGIHFQLNDHRDLTATKDDLTPAERAAKVISEDWQSSWTEANRVFDTVLSLALQP